MYILPIAAYTVDKKDPWGMNGLLIEEVVT